MEYKENALTYESYYRLRESVGWRNFSKTQAETALNNSLYTVIAVENKKAVAMGRLIGDGQYYMIADVIVHPDFQKQKIGTSILNMLLKHVDDQTPAGGRSSIQLIAEKGKEPFYETLGFKRIPHEFCGSGMRKVICKELWFFNSSDYPKTIFDTKNGAGSSDYIVKAFRYYLENNRSHRSDPKSQTKIDGYATNEDWILYRTGLNPFNFTLIQIY